MSKVKKAPNIESAAVTARVISARLRKAGFLMADTSDRYAWTEGFHVSRVGYSKDVSIGYHIPRYRKPEDITRARECYIKVREFLTAAGYVVEMPGCYVTCERD
jgi:hypothetical protein